MKIGHQDCSPRYGHQDDMSHYKKYRIPLIISTNCVTVPVYGPMKPASASGIVSILGALWHGLKKKEAYSQWAKQIP